MNIYSGLFWLIVFMETGDYCVVVFWMQIAASKSRGVTSYVRFLLVYALGDLFYM